jgi:UDP-3-O-[3-hydroxymyristoyl] N-acetylglucosamine deacetylase / 3-hydroxyacyl-[acyl-carrier-protein] dehydratase
MSSAPRQQTIGAEATLEGAGVHTGEGAKLRFCPAPEGTGRRFRRVDLEGRPEIGVALANVASTQKCTTLGVGETRVMTVEHVLAAVFALGIDNVVIEIDGPEVPILDGSFSPFAEALSGCGTVEQSGEAELLRLVEPVTALGPADASYAALPGSDLHVSCTIEYAHPFIGRQHGAFEVSAEAFRAELAPARTFGFFRDAEALHARGLARGASLDNAVVLSETELLTGELRFADEFVRHKAGDIIGDLALLGRRVHAHVLATRPSHAGNIELCKALLAVAEPKAAAPIVDIQKIMQHLPHRYPMLLVDRIIDFEPHRRCVGIKNVTINEPFFQGHYPGHPIMPGVLIIEAMAQVGGLLMMDAIENIDDKVVYFMSLDNVKWRRPVTPGDQIRFELEMLQMRRHVCRLKGVGYVDGNVVAEAEMMARIVDR